MPYRVCRMRPSVGISAKKVLGAPAQPYMKKLRDPVLDMHMNLRAPSGIDSASTFLPSHPLDPRNRPRLPLLLLELDRCQDAPQSRRRTHR
jgi:hypothetical protein